MADNKKIHIFGGGVTVHLRNHLALCAPAYGTVARELDVFCGDVLDELDCELHLSKMAEQDGDFETFDELDECLTNVIENPRTKIIFFTCAVPNFSGYPVKLRDHGYGELSFDIVEGEEGKHGERISSHLGDDVMIQLTPQKKLVSKIREKRKDIFLVAFKTTCGATENEQYIAGLNLLKESSCNLVLANDVETRVNMIITPEEARYSVSTDRSAVLKELVEMTKLRSHLTFTRSTVIAADPISWNDDVIPESLRKVVNFCIKNDAYKPFRGATVGHFACKIDDNLFITSKRKTNFNDIKKNGMVLVKTDGPDSVIAYGSKPSVGGQSQRIVFSEHPGMDCIVHFHCPMRTSSKVPVMSQREFECGSHECGKNTSNGLKQFGNLKAVFLDNHGPNIVFSRDINPQEVIDFIIENFDLSGKTGGYVS